MTLVPEPRPPPHLRPPPGLPQQPMTSLAEFQLAGKVPSVASTKA